MKLSQPVYTYNLRGNKQFRYYSFLLIFLLVSCTPTNQNEKDPPQPTATLSVSNPDSEVPSVIPHTLALLPEVYLEPLNSRTCSGSCFRSIALGQTIDEALEAIRNDPLVNQEHKYINDDYIEIYSDDQLGLTGINWMWQVSSSMDRGHVTIKDGGVTHIVIHPSWAIPITLFIQEFGKPSYVLTEYFNRNEIDFSLIYLEHDILLFFPSRGTSPTLSENNILESLALTNIPDFLESICSSSSREGIVQSWLGYGGLNVYYDDKGDLLNTVMLDC